MNQNQLEKFFRQWTEWKRRFIGIKDTSNRFSYLCKDILAGNKDFTQTAFHTGFGIPKNWGISLRLPAILIPILGTMRWLLRSWIIPPKFVIYQATNAISHINEINHNDALEISQVMESQLYSFVKEYFPELVEHISFHFWEQPWDTETLETILAYSRQLGSVLEQGALNHFDASRKKHSNADSGHLLYLAANNYYNWGYQEQAFPEVWEVQEIIPVGGRSETKFFETLLLTQQSCRDIFPLITQVWAFPTYYPRNDWDVMDSSDLTAFQSGELSLHPDIERDLKTLTPYL